MNRIAHVVTRRRVIAGIAYAGSLLGRQIVAQQPAMGEKPATDGNQSRTSLHYNLEFAAAPGLLYRALLDGKQFSAMTGLPASIDPSPGGALSMFNGMIVGRNVELIDDQRIVQAWRPTHWDSGVYSIVHFEFSARQSGSALVFDHTGFPAGEYDHLDWGWEHHYWEAMRKITAG